MRKNIINLVTMPNIARKIYKYPKQFAFMSKDSMDKKDLDILEALKANARASIRDMAKQTDIRPSTVYQRMNRMVDEGVIERFTVKVNDEKVGQGFVVFMLVSGTPERYLDDRFLKNEHVKEIYGITGEYDLLLKLKFKDLNGFNDFILDFREKYAKNISKTLTMVQTVKLKEE